VNIYREIFQGEWQADTGRAIPKAKLVSEPAQSTAAVDPNVTPPRKNPFFLMTFCLIEQGFSYFPKEVAATPRMWNRQLGDVVFEREQDKGGHFAAWEQPEAPVKDIRDMFRCDGAAYKAFGKWTPPPFPIFVKVRILVILGSSLSI
jgi:hypothetical protein